MRSLQERFGDRVWFVGLQGSYGCGEVMGTGRYIRRQKDLMEVVSAEERQILEVFMNLKKGAAVDFAAMSENLFRWAKNRINQ